MRTLLVVALLALPGLPAVAQVYRWVDERGVVNYASVAPAGVRATRVDSAVPRTGLQPDAGVRPLVPPASAAAHSGPPGGVDRATLDALGRALEARRGQRFDAEAQHHAAGHAIAQHGSLPLAP